jgi:site-specific DNA-methyltransferase (adenine-specific)
MADANVHFSSDTDEWPTPQPLFDQLDAEFHFTVDVCATSENAKCTRYYTKAENGLQQNWSNEIAWMNPPFGHCIKFWMEKAFESSYLGSTVVCLVPARTDTRWWHRFAMHSDEIRVLDRRLQFIGAAQKAPFPAALVVFRPTLLSASCRVPVLRAQKVPSHSKRELMDKVPANEGLFDDEA